MTYRLQKQYCAYLAQGMQNAVSVGWNHKLLEVRMDHASFNITHLTEQVTIEKLGELICVLTSEPGLKEYPVLVGSLAVAISEAHRNVEISAFVVIRKLQDLLLAGSYPSQVCKEVAPIILRVILKDNADIVKSATAFFLEAFEKGAVNGGQSL